MLSGKKTACKEFPVACAYILTLTHAWLVDTVGGMDTYMHAHRKQEDSSHRLAVSFFSFPEQSTLCYSTSATVLRAPREKNQVPFICNGFQFKDIEVPAFLIIQELCNTRWNIIDSIWH